MLIIFATQVLYAQKPFANSVHLESAIFVGYAQPVSIALWKFDGDDQLDLSLYKELIKNPRVHEKFLIFPFKSIGQQKKALNLKSLSSQDSRLRKTLKKELDISVILFGERKVNGKIQLSIMDTESSKILFTGEFEESLNSSIEADIVKLLLSDEKTVYQNIGSLDLILNPTDCAVKLDGSLILLREKIELNAGRHYLTVSKDGYYSKSDSVVIVSNQKTLLTISLKEITGRIVITSIPPASKIFRKGETIIKMFKSSIDTIDIKPGEYTLEFEASGYKKKDKIVRVEENREMILDISLEKEELPATLSVSVNFKDSEILIKEGEQIKKTSKGELKDFSINKGKYKIIVSGPGYNTQEKNIELYVGQSLLEQFTLSRDDINLSKNDLTGVIEISVAPIQASDAQIYLNNVLQGSAPLSISLMPGYYRLVARKSNFKYATKDVTLRKNGKEKILFNMEPIGSTSIGTDGTEIKSKIAPLIDLINIPSGEFMMGRNNGASDERPQHLVQITSFLIGKFEVTFNQYYNFCIATGRDYDQYGDLTNGNYPAINVSWQDAFDFCTWLSSSTGKKYRLPSEAEWEYAASAGKSENGSLYSGLNSFEFVGWGHSNSDAKIHNVGTKLPNEFGIHDMSGNAWEWCSDWYLNSYYQKSEKTNPQGPIEGKLKVLRGGSWNVDSAMCTVFKRQKSPTSIIDSSIGFRVVLEEK